ncbi:hypothetical protein V6N13_148653 [Hibiscus sabdariffa]
MQKQQHIQEVKTLDAFCDQCGSNHDASECGQQVESSCYVGNYNRNTMSNTYNPAWTNHPNFSWKNQNNTLNPQQPTQTGFQNQPRSGKILKNNYGETAVNPPPATDTPAEADAPAQASEDHQIPQPNMGESSAESSHAQPGKPEETRPPPPFPQRLKKQKQDYRHSEASPHKPAFSGSITADAKLRQIPQRHGHKEETDRGI